VIGIPGGRGLSLESSWHPDTVRTHQPHIGVYATRPIVI
jgi:hypothetical protein